MNLKHILPAVFLFAFIFTIFGVSSVNAASTTCGLVNVDYNDNLTIGAGGETGSFTVTIFNSGTATQHISASAQCTPNALDCALTGIGDNTLLDAGQQKSFSLNVQSSTAGTYAIPAEFRAGPSASTCTTQLTFNLNVLPAAGQTVQALNAWIDPATGQNARPADEVTYAIGLKNNVNKRIFASVASKGTNPFESSTSLSASNVALISGETKYISITVRVPPGTPGGTYQWIYHVDAGSNYNALDLPVSITVDAPILNLQLLNSPAQDQCTIVTASNVTSTPFSLQNNGELTGPFDLSIVGTSTVTGITTLTEPHFALQNGERKQFNINIAATPHTPIDNYTYKLRGNYQGFTFLDRSFCFKIQGITTVNVSAPRNIVIERTRISNTVINVTNTGTVSDQYALSIIPNSNVNVQIQPSTFTLAPGETQVVALAITSTLSTPLGNHPLTLRLDSQRYSKNIALNATVYATGRTGESLLRVTSPAEVKLSRGIAKAFNTTIENVGTTILRDVSITLNDMNDAWYASETHTILPGDSEDFITLVTIPVDTNDSQFSANLTATSGAEFVTSPIAYLPLSSLAG